MFREPPEFFEKVGGRRAFFGLFGKHRAWADHMDDQGMESPTLIEFKKRLYLDGIRGVIDSGFWKEMPDEDKVPKWGHRMLVHSGDGILLAVLWQSKDQRGRSEYPLIAAIHVATGHLPLSLEPLWAIFDELEAPFKEAESQEEVRRLADRVPDMIDKTMRSVRPLPEDGLPIVDRQQFLSSSAMGDQQEGLYRFLYRVSVDLKDFLPGRPTATEPRAFRLPLVEDMGEGGLIAYLNLLRSQIGKRYTVVMCQTLGAGYFDLSVGGMHERFVADLKCSRKKVALVTDVAFNIPDDTGARIQDVIATFSTEPLNQVLILADPEAKEKGKSFFGSIMNRLSNK